jgi:ABC-2 type transport system permease protein
MNRLRKIILLGRQVWANTIQRRGTKGLILLINLLLFFSLIVGYLNHSQHQELVHGYGEDVRDQWENSPDKHPHRMAHYGYLVFREKFPLAFFDFGMDSYLGNVIFLEAHKQNTVNFSEANLSNGLLRFGEISAGMILQVLIPLLVFFWGYDLISRDREQGTLKILFAQGVQGFELIWGRTLGLFLLNLSTVILPFMLGFILLFFQYDQDLLGQSLAQYLLMLTGYLVYFLVLSLVAVWVSGISQSSKAALTTLIGCWLLFTLVVPKVSQVIGQTLFPTPSKIEFDSAVEAELILHGDSHNPNDPHYAALKDSVLRVHGVDSVQQLPFNYSGFVMREGERLSTETYLSHQRRLVELFKSQQQVITNAAWIDPFLAIKNLSMGMSGTDYDMYLHFQDQAEAYRYLLAQTMNELQIDLISNRIKNSSDPSARLSNEYWEQFPDFHQAFLSIPVVVKNQAYSMLILVLWLTLFSGIVWFFSDRLKAF